MIKKSLIFLIFVSLLCGGCIDIKFKHHLKNFKGHLKNIKHHLINNSNTYNSNKNKAPLLYEIVNNIYLDDNYILKYNIYDIELNVYPSKSTFDYDCCDGCCRGGRKSYFCGKGYTFDYEGYGVYQYAYLNSAGQQFFLQYTYKDKYYKTHVATDREAIAKLDEIYHAENKVFISNYLTYPDISIFIDASKYKIDYIVNLIDQKLITHPKNFTNAIFLEKIASREEAKNGYELYLEYMGKHPDLNNAVNLAYVRFKDIAERLTMLHNNKEILISKYIDIYDMIKDIDNDIQKLSKVGYKLARATKNFFKLAKRQMARIEITGIRTKALKGLKTFSQNINDTKSRQYESIEDATEATIRALEKFEEAINQ
ncbi:hypothetical protein GMMP15_1680002 [Candidatus Magnetomoraceae bacterium gMMP-15]